MHITKSFLLLLTAIPLLLISCVDNDPPKDQLSVEVDAIDAYLASNNTDYVGYDQSGIRLVIHQFGELPPPHTGQTIDIPYSASLFSNGTVFETDTLTGKLESISVPGLRYGISALPGGTRASIYIPSAYAFGSTGKIGVPANSSVVYSVTVKGITRSDAEQTRFVQDTAAIHQHLFTAEVSNVIEHPSGISYTVQTSGTGSFPKVYDRVTMEYSGRLLSTGAVFDQGTLNGVSVFGLIDGLKVGIPLMRVGGEATFYIPSGLGYGPAGSGGAIPSNANLIFTIKVTGISE